ncbi:MAG TPA: trypsin-like peptidase domain-containing protein, partial [Cyclobacteriaceae bacterium]|nr:trypsin-like peptidase domain-containing protein [Cyclobacteriaceae bacterium]
MKRTLLFSVIAAVVVSMLTTGAIIRFGPAWKTIKIEHIDAQPAKEILYTRNSSGEFFPVDFTGIAEKVMPAVVHIRSTVELATARAGQRSQENIPDQFRDMFGDDLFRRFFGPDFDEGPDNHGYGVSTGSGVILNDEGYIVTNNHVIADANDIEVTLHDNRSYKASVIGADPMTDLAVIRIKEKNLPTLPLVNSDEVKVGEWVMAVGNPFNLNSTVTAGIVSAKSRNINILRDQYAIEAFIQTDAAINPGNSGGALVNLQGGLIGINTAIQSTTGAYAGYGFAVPSNLVDKVVGDILKYGNVQRGYLGVNIRSINAELARDKKLDLTEGVYVDSVLENSAAQAADVRVGDVILEV